MGTYVSQGDAILTYLKNGYSLTPLEALERFGCLRLGARIWDLKKQGVDIETQTIHANGKHFAAYRIRKVSAR